LLNSEYTQSGYTMRVSTQERLTAMR